MNSSPANPSPIIWEPGADDRQRARITDFSSWLLTNRALRFTEYTSLWEWSVQQPESFWAAIWEYFEIDASQAYDTVLTTRSMPDQEWFTGSQLSYAEHMLRSGSSDEVAVIAVDEGQPPSEVTWGELRGQVGALAGQLRELGVQPGDRVAGYLPNILPALVSMLATTSIGAVWTACSPDFGFQAVVDRFGQVEPKVLIAVDGYRFNGREFDRVDVTAQLAESLPSVIHTVLVRSLRPNGSLPHGLRARLYDELVSQPREPAPVHVDFGHPLWILFSSGTTGKPKGIVQSHGGILVEHLKALGLGLDLGPEDRYFFHCSTSWMAWNFLVGGLLHGSTVVLYSGSPTSTGQLGLWELAADVRATVLGMGSAYVQACAKTNAELIGQLDLSALRTVIPTGSPLPLPGWTWLHEQLDAHTRIDAICGGTDVCTAFFGGSPIVPVRLGEISCRWLGVDAWAYDQSGTNVTGEVGEFVVTTPMPSMPVALWQDTDNMRLKASYFETFPGAWRQGDWIMITPAGGVKVLGRSDATLNRGGVRLGSADLYTLVEALPGVEDSLVVGVELPDGDYYMPLFVVPTAGTVMDASFREGLNQTIRENLSPRHVPDEIVEVAGLPRTLTGKKLEIPVKRILQGHPADSAVAMGSIDRPDYLRWFEQFAHGRRAPS